MKEQKSSPSPGAFDPLQSAGVSTPLAKSASALPTKSPNIGRKVPLGFNPLAMLPGAGPLKKEPSPAAVSFDAPVETAGVLQSLNKVIGSK